MQYAPMSTSSSTAASNARRAMSTSVGTNWSGSMRMSYLAASSRSFRGRTLVSNSFSLIS